MFKSILILILLSFFVGLAAWLVFIWSVKKGTYDDIERPKYRMLEDDSQPDTASQDDKTTDNDNSNS